MNDNDDNKVVINDETVVSSAPNIEKTTDSVAVEKTGDKPVKKKKSYVIMAALLIVALLLCGCFLVKKYLICNPVKVTTDIVDELGKKIGDFIEETNGLYGDLNNQSMVNNINFEIGNVKGDFNNIIDFKEKLFSLSAKLDMEETNYFDLSALASENGVYFKVLKDSLNYYKAEVDLKNAFSELDYEKGKPELVERLFGYFSDSFEKYIKSEDFQKSKTTITVDGESVNATKYYITLGKSNFKPVVDDFIDRIKNDNEIIKLLEENNETLNSINSSDESRDLLEELKNEIEYNDITYSLYIKGTKLVKIGLAGIDDSGDIEIVTYKGIKIDMISDGEQIIISKNDKELLIKASSAILGKDGLVFRYDEKSGEFVLKALGEEVLNGTLKSTKTDSKSETTIKFTMIAEKNISGTINITSETKSSSGLAIPTESLDINIEENKGKLMDDLYNIPYIKQLVDSISSLQDYYKNGYNFDYKDEFDEELNENIFDSLFGELEY